MKLFTIIAIHHILYQTMLHIYTVICSHIKALQVIKCSTLAGLENHALGCVGYSLFGFKVSRNNKARAA